MSRAGKIFRGLTVTVTVFVVGLMVLTALVALSGCAAYDGLIGHPLKVLHQQHENNEREPDRPAETDRPASAGTGLHTAETPNFLIPDRLKPGLHTTTGLHTPQTARRLRLEWDYLGVGPVRFEVWHATNLAAFSWSGGTNVPAGFGLLTNVESSPVPLAGNQGAEFFIVRAVNEFGPSDWAANGDPYQNK